MYWCSTGITGISSPTISPVLRAKLPVAETTCSQVISPLSVVTSHSPFGCGSIAVTVVLRLISAPRLRAPRGESLGEIGGLDIAVLGMLDCADDVAVSAQRPDFLDLDWASES